MTQAAEEAVFRTGQVWQSPRGTFYCVDSVEMTDGVRMATLRLGIDGSGRKSVREEAKTRGWRFIAPISTPALVQQAMDGKL